MLYNSALNTLQGKWWDDRKDDQEFKKESFPQDHENETTCTNDEKNRWKQAESYEIKN